MPRATCARKEVVAMKPRIRSIHNRAQALRRRVSAAVRSVLQELPIPIPFLEDSD